MKEDVVALLVLFLKRLGLGLGMELGLAGRCSSFLLKRVMEVLANFEQGLLLSSCRGDRGGSSAGCCKSRCVCACRIATCP